MSNPSVLIALRKLLSEIPGLPDIVWPNQEISVAAPYLIFDDGIEAGAPVTVDGMDRIELSPQISSVVQAGAFTAGQDATLWTISQALKAGTQLTDDSGVVLGIIAQNPTTDSGYPDKHGYRRNLSIRIRTFQEF